MVIRLAKPVKLYEWGAGTNTLNQVWSEMAEGRIRASKIRPEATTLEVEVDGSLTKKNPRDDTVKLAQLGEGMTARSERWGEVAFGRVKDIRSQAGKTVVSIEISVATKLSRK